MKRIPRLDGLRALAFLAVFLNHSIQVPMAWVGVDLFFVLSGFLITSILLQASTQGPREFFLHFYQRRARRILPPYFLVLGLVALIFRDIDWPAIWWQFFLFIQNQAVAFGEKVGVLNPYWSLAVEEQFYLVWPLILYFLPRRVLPWICVALILIAPLLRACFTPHASAHTVIFCLTPFRMDLLAAGALVALLWSSQRERLARSLPLVSVVAVLAGAGLFAPALVVHAWRASANSLIFNVAGYSLSVLFFSTLLVVVLTSTHRAWDLLLCQPTLVALGQISYMCYLLHEPVLSLAFDHFGRFGGSLVALAVTLGLAALSWRFIEQPILLHRSATPNRG